MQQQITELDKELLNLLQKGLPITSRPFKKIGEFLNLEADQVIKKIILLKEKKILREIRAIIDYRTLGYQSSLVALEVTEENLKNATDLINSISGVSHNYLRNHNFNIWFTLTIPSHQDLLKTIENISLQVKARNYLNLTAIKEYKIGIFSDLKKPLTSTTNKSTKRSFHLSSLTEISDMEQFCLKNLHQGIPLIYNPFANLAKRIGIAENEIIKITKSLIRKKVIRRISATLNLFNLGFAFNALVVWKIKEENNIDEYGKIMSSFNAVSHCYQRVSYPSWPYQLYTMIHSRTQSELDEVLNKIKTKTNPLDYKVLTTLEELKKKKIDIYQNSKK